VSSNESGKKKTSYARKKIKIEWGVLIGKKERLRCSKTPAKPGSQRGKGSGGLRYEKGWRRREKKGAYLMT